MSDANANLPKLDQLLRDCPQLWRGRAPQRPRHGIPSGWPALDAALPDGGWPPQGLVEVLSSGQGQGQVSLWLPAAARLARDGLGLVLIHPPAPPYAPALVAAGVDLSRCAVLQTAAATDALWAAERAARSAACGLVLFWPSRIDTAQARRLQLAADEGRTLLVAFLSRPRPELRAVLRLRIDTEADGRRRLDVLKVRGSHRRAQLHLPAWDWPTTSPAGEVRQ